jgi:hypothetical protein
MYDRTQKKSKKSIVVVVNGKAWDKESIKKLIQTNDKAVYRALVLRHHSSRERVLRFSNHRLLNGWLYTE